jgi:hypothetical protein
MDSSPSTPPADERAALAKLEAALQDAEAAVRAAPTPRMLWRARVMLDRMLRFREIEQARREFGEIVADIHKRVRESGLPELTDEEIQAEVDAVRAGESR